MGYALLDLMKYKYTLMSIDYQELLPHKALGKQISLNIFQTYRTKQNLPPEIEQNIEHIKRYNPEYEYKLFDDDDIKAFILEHYGVTIWNYYARISPIYGAARADFFRYLLIYQQGGVYLDIKSSLDKPLKDVLRTEDQFILTHWDNEPGGQYEGIGIFAELDFLPRGEYIQWCIASVPGHHLLRAIILQMLRNIDEYNPFVHGAGLWGVLRTTGPVMYTKVIEAMRPTLIKDQDYRLLNKPQDIGLRYSIYDTQGIYGHKKALKANYNKAYTPIITTPNRPLYTQCAKVYLFIRLVTQVVRDKISQRLNSET